MVCVLNFIIIFRIYDLLCGLVVRAPGYRSRGQVQFPALPDFPRSNRPGTGSTQPCEYIEKLLGGKK
jgi:hypothetical protein